MKVPEMFAIIRSKWFWVIINFFWRNLVTHRNALIIIRPQIGHNEEIYIS